MHRKVKKPKPSGCNPDPTQCESEAMLHALVAQSRERRTSNAEDPGGRPGGGATFGGDSHSDGQSLQD